jgi:hypothetical protein
MKEKEWAPACLAKSTRAVDYSKDFLAAYRRRKDKSIFIKKVEEKVHFRPIK